MPLRVKPVYNLGQLEECISTAEARRSELPRWPFRGLYFFPGHNCSAQALRLRQSCRVVAAADRNHLRRSYAAMHPPHNRRLRFCAGPDGDITRLAHSLYTYTLYMNDSPVLVIVLIAAQLPVFIYLYTWMYVYT